MSNPIELFKVLQMMLKIVKKNILTSRLYKKSTLNSESRRPKYDYAPLVMSHKMAKREKVNEKEKNRAHLAPKRENRTNLKRTGTGSAALKCASSGCGCGL